MVEAPMTPTTDPVTPEMIEAREILAAFIAEEDESGTWAKNIHRGYADKHPAMLRLVDALAMHQARPPSPPGSDARLSYMVLDAKRKLLNAPRRNIGGLLDKALDEVTADLDAIERHALTTMTPTDEGLREAGKHLLDMIDTQQREVTPTPKRETVDDANSRDERDQVFGDAVERFRAALNQPIATMNLIRVGEGWSIEHMARALCKVNFDKKGCEAEAGNVDDCWWAFTDEATAILEAHQPSREGSE